jgi:hypothetical protein
MQLDDLLRLIILLSLGIGLAFMGVDTQPVRPAEPPRPPSGSIPGSDGSWPLVVEDVSVTVLESYQMQLHLTVRGYWSNGCEAPVDIQQRRWENTVTVQIVRQLPADAICPAVIIPVETVIPLEGGFTSGTYTIRVNGFETQITL